MKNVTLIPFFCIAFVAHMTLSFFSQTFPFLYFAPFFVTCFSRSSLYFSIWTSFAIGLFLDLCTTSTPMGFYPICMVLTTVAIHRFKIYFLEDKVYTFSLYTTLYSITYTIIFMFLHTFIDPKFHISLLSFLSDSIFLPILDTLYHLVFFTFPISSYIYLTSKKQQIRFRRIRRRLFEHFPKLKKVFSR
ncbi:MAG: hypothetical protein S4CHLAM20_08920 [Chlamydiia bacterium]|nr:hypothetical protein [Chlamydiia bacterium]